MALGYPNRYERRGSHELLECRRREADSYLRNDETGYRRGERLGDGRRLLDGALHAHYDCRRRRLFAQPEVRHGSNTTFMWTLLAGFKNALRYGLVGDHIDAREALRIGLVNKVVPIDQLLEECFNIVERIAHVRPKR